MKAAAQPRLVYGSMTAVTMCRARNTSVIKARLRCRPVVRKRGQLSLWTRSVDRMPRTTTALRRISVTAPAPRVVYQRTLLLTAQRDPPVTTTPVEVDEPTLLDDWMVEEDEEVDESFVVLVELDAALDDAAVPGIVAALTAAKIPTPATAASEAPTVRRSSRRRASSRDRARARVVVLGSMPDRLRDRT